MFKLGVWNDTLKKNLMSKMYTIIQIVSQFNLKLLLRFEFSTLQSFFTPVDQN